MIWPLRRTRNSHLNLVFGEAHSAPGTAVIPRRTAAITATA
jgi:hypothetical protein